MARERRLVETFVTLADTLVDDFDVIDFLQTLTERCVELLDVSAAGIMLVDELDVLRHVACSNEQMRLVELFELQVEEGPCYDAYQQQQPVICGSPEEAADRWPRFAPHAIEHGFSAVAGVPMRLRDQVIGSLNLFSTQARALTDEDTQVVQALAGVATIGILQERAIRDSSMLTTQLRRALESRIVIEQAKGIVAERSGITVDDAFTRIRTFARAHNRLLSQTAREVIDGTLRPDDLDDRNTRRSAPST
jgi:GAF domain-containing protein